MPERSRHTPQRMCVICRRRFDQAQLRRHVAGEDGALVLDADGKMPGRGWYCCGDAPCQEKFLRFRPRKKAGKGGKRLASQGDV